MLMHTKWKGDDLLSLIKHKRGNCMHFRDTIVCYYSFQHNYFFNALSFQSSLLIYVCWEKKMLCTHRISVHVDFFFFWTLSSSFNVFDVVLLLCKCSYCATKASQISFFSIIHFGRVHLLSPPFTFNPDW